MVEIRRTGEAEWQGNLKKGSGTLGTGSGVLKDQPYGFRTRKNSSLRLTPPVTAWRSPTRWPGRATARKA